MFTLVTQLRSGFIVEDISTGKKQAFLILLKWFIRQYCDLYFDQRSSTFEVMKNIAEKFDYKETINHKSSDNELKAFMSSVLPNYDVDRVYGSDIKN